MLNSPEGRSSLLIHIFVQPVTLINFLRAKRATKQWPTNKDILTGTDESLRQMIIEAVDYVLAQRIVGFPLWSDSLVGKEQFEHEAETSCNVSTGGMVNSTLTLVPA